MQHSADIADRHASIAVTGQGSPAATAVGRDLTDKFSAATDPAPGFWIEDGGALQERLHKTELITAQSVSDKLMVRRLARQRLEEGLVKSGELVIDVGGHRQSEQHPIWGCDTVIDVEFGPREISAPYYIWNRTLNYDSSGRTTRLGAIPAGFWYGYDHNTFDDQSYLSDLTFRYKRYAL
jgi:prophage tail gpP-like protein